MTSLVAFLVRLLSGLQAGKFEFIRGNALLAEDSSASGFVEPRLTNWATASAAHVRLALSQAHVPRRASIVPPLLNAWALYQAMAAHSRM